MDNPNPKHDTIDNSPLVVNVRFGGFDYTKLYKDEQEGWNKAQELMSAIMDRLNQEGRFIGLSSDWVTRDGKISRACVVRVDNTRRWASCYSRVTWGVPFCIRTYRVSGEPIPVGVQIQIPVVVCSSKLALLFAPDNTVMPISKESDVSDITSAIKSGTVMPGNIYFPSKLTGGDFLAENKLIQIQS